MRMMMAELSREAERERQEEEDTVVDDMEANAKRMS
jgi:hypothetical protein